MSLNILIRSSVFIILFIVLTSFISNKEKDSSNRNYTDGELQFTIKTSTSNGVYAPKNVFAIWVGIMEIL